MKKILYILIVLSVVVAGGVGAWRYWSFKSTARSIPLSEAEHEHKEEEGIIRLDEKVVRSAGIAVEEVKRMWIDEYITVTGEVRANAEKEAYITSRIPGKVVEVKTRLGEDVDKGEMLLTIDSVEVEQIKGDLVEANANLRTGEINLKRESLLYDNKSKILDIVKKGIKAEEAMTFLKDAELGKAKADILKPLTRLELTESNLKREKELYQDNISSAKDVIAAEKEYTSAGIEFQTGVEEMFLNAKQELSKAEAEYTSAKSRVEKLKGALHLYGFSDKEIESMIDESRRHEHPPIPIVSPFKGRIVERMVTVGEVVDTSTKLFKLIDLSTVWVWANVYEKDLGKVKVGQTAYITVTPYPDRVFTGRITYISDTVDPNTRIVKVRAELENPPTPPFTKGGQGGLLKPEMFASVKMKVGQALSLAVPESAIQRDGENTIVFMAKDETSFEKRVVSLGTEVDGYHQVLSGFKEGERIVTKGAFTLKSESLKGLMEEE